MDKAGIYSQAGFEFQKLVFIFQALSLAPYMKITYEGKDDVELNTLYFPISAINRTDLDKLIQVKSGVVSKDTIEKVFMNWLLEMDDYSKGLVCFVENEIEYHKETNFIEELINKIKNTDKDERAIIKKVQRKYTSVKNYSELQSDLEFIVKNVVFEINSIPELKNKTFEEFKKFYPKSDYEFINTDRFDEYVNEIRNIIADAMLDRRNCELTFADQFAIISNINDRISEKKYEVEYSKFKPRCITKLQEVMNKNTASIKQLRLISNKENFIVERLTEQIFYEDLRDFYCKGNKSAEVYSLELLAHSNYDDALMDIEQSGDYFTPYKVYSKTVSRELKSCLLSPGTENIKFYSNGCYIHLTDDGIDENLKIEWGELDEE